MSKRNYVVLCEERCCECKGEGATEDKGPCHACEGKGYTQYSVNLRKALVDLIFYSLMTGDTDE